MRTNHLMLTDLLKTYHPETRGVVNAKEVELITCILCLNDMNILQLRNLRDFAVLFLTKKGTETSAEDWDRMSAITCVIDNRIFDLGGEV